MMNAFGAVESIFFRGVGPGGYDIYGVKFAKGFAEFRILMTADGKADDVTFRPDGNDAQGGIAACSGEAGLKQRSDTAPIKLFIYNGTGSRLQLYNLGADGQRLAQGTIGEDASFGILTYVDSPVIVADASGKCLEVVLPGQQTRFHTVGERRADGEIERVVSQRTAPQPGSEAMLRQYIEALARGEPDYGRMTSEVAAQTRQQLAVQSGHSLPVRHVAVPHVPRRLGDGQRRLHRAFRQRIGGMADRPRQGRHDRPDRAGTAILVPPT